MSEIKEKIKDMTNKLYYEQKEVRLMFTDVGRWVKEKDYQALETENAELKATKGYTLLKENIDQARQLQKLKLALADKILDVRIKYEPEVVKNRLKELQELLKKE